MGETYETRLVRPRHLKELLEAERTGVPFLHWLDGDGEQHILMLPADRARVTIGRREQSDVPLPWDGRRSMCPPSASQRVSWRCIAPATSSSLAIRSDSSRVRHRLRGANRRQTDS